MCQGESTETCLLLLWTGLPTWACFQLRLSVRGELIRADSAVCPGQKCKCGLEGETCGECLFCCLQRRQKKHHQRHPCPTNPNAQTENSEVHEYANSCGFSFAVASALGVSSGCGEDVLWSCGRRLRGELLIGNWCGIWIPTGRLVL